MTETDRELKENLMSISRAAHCLVVKVVDSVAKSTVSPPNWATFTLLL